ncbi:hypothetical protein SFBM_0601 [Candidatus Arthromitus sp. SFB-mouse-Japan]|uniref:zinc metallopeptidase n=1 Tax=Candidatus Arthromitus sp. SFB-mouse TaxID=49118 RepID=UPI00021B8003|nr:zinc metallopeptidase [Candidatus Arthromitus sp. SFB-mouse]EIA21729.1 hypothetical protein SFB1_359G4 [Candidatus Arthromitus sp. SFB-1]EIA27149.1 hypothetical protein SFB6_118G4 [Candidatus Arthromitus sp. SFB-co]EIA30650.1 Putative neutral zinc metallopeptidase [Candidatus Arthromitus sp. SFB-mouse-SU]EGX28944.1 neutral zinc metallopeptidase [Candidatus Arthromitus sp. SFB-mouse-NYU]BAK56379.1 hypothetical protein SFBM_0601 [Candidatus Arthromitus sp. SFB-mouse-Japan]
MFYFDRTIILLIPAIIVSAIAQFKISSAYNKYSKVTNQRGITGEQAAINILKANGIYDVEVEMVNGRMTDHYDPRAKKLRLSQEVYFGTSIAAVGIASHEVGHAIQHNVSYTPLILRNAIVPAVNFGAGFSWILFLLGLIMGIKPLLTIGIVLFSLTVIFQLVTLPVEFNASNRAIKSIKNMGLLVGNEVNGAKSVLSSAALTYVAAALMSIMSLLRLIVLARGDE